MARPASSRVVLPSLYVGGLRVQQVEAIFGLTRVNNTDWTRMRAPIEFPQEHEDHLANCEQGMAYSGSEDLNNMASHEMLHLFAVVAKENDLLTQTLQSPSPFPIWRSCQFKIQPIRFEGENKSLMAEAWQTLWFHPTDSMNYLDVNFFAHETEIYEEQAPVPSILAMMAMVWSQRRDGHMAQHNIYGLAKNREKFTFLQLKPNGEWSKYQLRYPLHFQEILEIFAYFFQEARRLMVSYYGVNGDMTHFAATNENSHASNSQQHHATSRRGICTLEILETRVDPSGVGREPYDETEEEFSMSGDVDLGEFGEFILDVDYPFTDQGHDE